MPNRLIAIDKSLENLSAALVWSENITAATDRSETLTGSLRYTGVLTIPNYPKSILEFSQQIPIWLEDCVQQLHEISFLEEDWDSYGGRKIEADAIQSALELLINIMQHDTPAPSIVPTSNGSVQLEWHMKDIEFEIELESLSRLQVYYHDSRTNTEIEEEIPVSNLIFFEVPISELTSR